MFELRMICALPPPRHAALIAQDCAEMEAVAVAMQAVNTVSDPFIAHAQAAQESQSIRRSKGSPIHRETR